MVTNGTKVSYCYLRPKIETGTCKYGCQVAKLAENP